MSSELYNDGPVVHQPTFIDGTSVEIPELKILKQDGSTYEGAELPDMDENLALKVYKTFCILVIWHHKIMTNHSLVYAPLRSIGGHFFPI